MQEIPATNSQNMNITTDLPVNKVWIVRYGEGYDVCEDYTDAYDTLKDKIIDYMPEYDKADRINDEYGCFEIGAYYYDAYEIANCKGIVDEVLGDMIDNAGVCDIDDYGETASSEIWEEVDIIVGMAIEESNGDVHYIKDIDDYNGMSDPTELTDTEGNEWTVIVHDDGTLTASRKVEEPKNQYYIYVIGVKDGFPYQTTCSYDTEDEFTHGLIKLVEQGYTTVGNIGRLGCITQTTVVKEMTN